MAERAGDPLYDLIMSTLREHGGVADLYPPDEFECCGRAVADAIRALPVEQRMAAVGMKPRLIQNYGTYYEEDS